MTRTGLDRLPVVDQGKLLGVIDKPSTLQTLYAAASLDFAHLRRHVFPDHDEG